MDILQRFFSGCRSVAEVERLVEVVADLASATGPRVRLTIETWPGRARVEVSAERRTEFASPDAFVAELERLDALCSEWGQRSFPGRCEWWGELTWPEVAS